MAWRGLHLSQPSRLSLADGQMVIEQEDGTFAAHRRCGVARAGYAASHPQRRTIVGLYGGRHGGHLHRRDPFAQRCHASIPRASPASGCRPAPGDDGRATQEAPMAGHHSPQDRQSGGGIGRSGPRRSDYPGGDGAPCGIRRPGQHRSPSRASLLAESVSPSIATTRTDRRNKLLNYGYAVARSAIGRALVANGLLPAFGLHHASVTNAFNLADDLLEPFRPLSTCWPALRSGQPI